MRPPPATPMPRERSTHRGTLRLRQATRRCRTPEVGYHLAAAPAQQVLQPCRHPGLRLQWCCRVEGFGRWPQIPQDMDQVEHHPQLYAILCGRFVEETQLGRIAIDQC